MSEFSNVSIVKAANVYFDGKVSSRTIKFADGSTKTLGLILPGEYEFNTGDKELMEILSGDTEVQLAGASDWQTVRGGGQFEVPANSSFKIKAITIADYCCSFIK
jgi:purine/pyrimidine-nucleoside phosphorylase